VVVSAMSEYACYFALRSEVSGRICFHVLAVSAQID